MNRLHKCTNIYRIKSIFIPNLSLKLQTWFHMSIFFFFAGDSSEAIRLYRNGLQVIENSDCTGLDDSYLERFRMIVAALLHKDGR